jgi:cell division protease FtsH
MEPKLPPEDGQKGPPKNSPQFLNVLVIGIVITFVLNTFIMNMMSGKKVQIEYGQFIQLVEDGAVQQVRIEADQIALTLWDDADRNRVAQILPVNAENSRAPRNQVYYTGRLDDPGLTQRLIDKGVAFYKPIVQSNPILNFISGWIFPLLIFYGIYYFVMRNFSKSLGGGIGGMMNLGKSKAKYYDMEKNTGVSFNDVAGQDEAKESLTELVDFLHSPEKYRNIGAKQPKGALLVGPPGTGKTLLAKAVAGEAKVPFYSLSGSEFVEMFVGVGASRVRDLFGEAAKHAPCIIFIDEIDAIGKSRDSQLGGNDEREQTLNQLLAEMDGFDSSKGVLILAATNRPEILDKALLRPGRFDRRIIVENPDLPGREAILEVHAKKVVLGRDVRFREIALATSGATGADLANMVNEAALRAVRLGRAEVLQEDLLEAVEVVIAGKEKKGRILNPKEKRMVAFHETGHALASVLQSDQDVQPVQKITIIPRTMGALGYTMNMPEEERYLMTKSELLARITTLLAGRAAEETEFGEMSTGASNDIERATKLARSMITQYGMGDKFGMMALESLQNQYLDGRYVSTVSEATGAGVDREVARILEECHQKALVLLRQNREKLTEIAAFLIERETINGPEFMEILKGRKTA